MDFLLLLAISQHRIAHALRVSFISCGAVQSIRRWISTFRFSGLAAAASPYGSFGLSVGV
ncbi:hypothetical protein ACH0BF_04795 [Pseudobacillus sp. 179-B 2D1 NHS]|uniref:hypothetical protein n=1 Tax=Pseudobacillus sp. 179-B 2D1 NHS TaxID=3374292 RepID=UPI003879451C